MVSTSPREKVSRRPTTGPARAESSKSQRHFRAEAGAMLGVLGGGEQPLFARIVCLFAYLSLNSGLNMMNRWLLGVYKFQFPLGMSMFHLIFCFVVLTPLMFLKAFRSKHGPTLRKQWVGLLVIGICFALNLGLNNTSLVTISLSLNQVIRSSLPVVVAFFAVFIEKKIPTRLESASLLVLVVGVMVAAYQGAKQEDKLPGVLICIASTFSNAVMLSTSGKVLSEKLDVLRLTWYTAPVTVLALLPCYLAMEHDKLAHYSITQGNHFVPILFIGAAMALSYNLVHHLMIQWTSSVTITVIGEVKMMILLALSALLLDEAKVWTAKMSVGFLLAFTGFCMYSHVRLSLSQQQKKPPSGAQTDSEQAPLLLSPDKHKLTPEKQAAAAAEQQGNRRSH